MDAAAEARFNILRELRSKLAKRDSIVSFAVLHDRTLREIARRVPKNASDLLQISGVGPTKLQRYGAELLDALKNLPK